MNEQIDPPKNKEKCYAILAEVSAIAEVIAYAKDVKEVKMKTLANIYEEINIKEIEVENILKVEEIKE